MIESNNDLFKTIRAERNSTATEEVIFQLQEMIHRGDLRPGDRLPPERDRASAAMRDHLLLAEKAQAGEETESFERSAR